MTSRHITAIGLLLTVATFSLQAQTKEQLAHKKGPRFTFIGGPRYNFGNISDKRDAYHVFRYVNTGRRPLIITAATGSCGCTVPTFSKDPLKPGDTGEIKIVFHTTDRGGNFDKTIYLVSNAPGNIPERAPYELYIHGTVMPGAPFGNNMNE